MPSPIETIAARVLAEHRLTWWAVYRWKGEPGGSEVAPRCTCGVLWSAHARSEPVVQIASWEAHVAAEIARAIAEDQGALATVARVVRGWDHTDEPLDQYYFAAHELIDALAAQGDTP